MTRPLIRWTDEELAVVVKRAYEVRADARRNGFLMSEREAIEKGQLQLNPARRRAKIYPPSQDLRVFRAFRAYEAERKVVVADAAKITPIPIAAPVDELSELETALNALAEFVAERFSTALRTSLKQRLSSVIRGAEVELRGEAPTQQRLLRVVIYKMRPDQARFITDEYSKLFALRVINRDESLSVAQAACKMADHVIFMLDFMGHADEDTLEAGLKNVIKIRGGFSKLRDTLDKLYTLERAQETAA